MIAPGVTVAAEVAANVLRGLDGPGWSVAPMVGATWSPMRGISTAAGIEVGKVLGPSAGPLSGAEAFGQGWRENETGTLSAVAGLRWRF